MSEVAAPEARDPPAAASGLAQPVAAGLLTAIVGFASTFAVVLQGYRAVGADPAQAASGLVAVCVLEGVLGLALAWRTRLPITLAWSTPGAALLVATGTPAGGFPAATGAFLLASALVVAAGLISPFGRLVAAIPTNLAGAMLAGVLLDLCLAPVRAVAALPGLALPIVVVWALGWRFAPRYAVPLAVAVTAGIILAATAIPPLGDVAPRPVLVAPVFLPGAVVGIGLPLFLVTMASQNVPGLAVLRANGYAPPVGLLFVATGFASACAAMFGGHLVNLAAITAALTAGPEAGPDRGRRWIAGVVAGATYVAIGFGAGAAAAFIAAAPPLLIQAVAGLALLASLAGALTGALAREDERLPAIATFATTASGIAPFGVGAAFWGLLAGGALALLARARAVAPR